MSQSASAAPAGAQATSNHDGARALADLKELADTIGPRVAGSDSEQKAAAYIAAQFSADGYSVEMMPFTFEGDRFRPATLTLNGHDYALTTAAGSAGGEVSAPGVFVGLADDAGIGGRSLAGQVAVADRGTLTFGDKAANVARAGAIALVVLNNQPGGFSATLANASAIPVLGADGSDADALRTAARAAATVVLKAPPPGDTTAHDVIARPKTGARCALLVGGHYDTVVSAPGANDNASGTANVIELARAFAADGLDDGLCFAAFSAEESGLFGSAALVDRLKSEGSLPGLMLNLDVTGIGRDVQVIGDRAYVTQALDIARSLDIGAEESELPPNTGSDHISFQQAGVPVLFFTSGEFATIHSPADVSKDIDDAELDRVGDLAYATIAKLLPQVAHP